MAWGAAYRLGMENYKDAQVRENSVAAKDVVCGMYFRTFRRVGDRKRHKCVNQRRKPVSEQLGAVQC